MPLLVAHGSRGRRRSPILPPFPPLLLFFSLRVALPTALTDRRPEEQHFFFFFFFFFFFCRCAFWAGAPTRRPSRIASRRGARAASPRRAWRRSPSSRARRPESASSSMISPPVAVSRLPVGSSASTTRGSTDERPRDRDALLLAAGQVRRQMVGALGEPHLAEQLQRAGAIAAGRDELHLDVLDRGQRRDQVELLEDEAECAQPQLGELVVAELREVAALEQHLAARSAGRARRAAAAASSCRSRSALRARRTRPPRSRGRPRRARARSSARAGRTSRRRAASYSGSISRPASARRRGAGARRAARRPSPRPGRPGGLGRTRSRGR